MTVRSVCRSYTKGLTEKVGDTLSQLFTSIPVGQKKGHGWEEASIESVRIEYPWCSVCYSPFEEPQKKSTDTKASKVLNESHAETHQTPTCADSRYNPVEL